MLVSSGAHVLSLGSPGPGPGVDHVSSSGAVLVAEKVMRSDQWLVLFGVPASCGGREEGKKVVHIFVNFTATEGTSALLGNNLSLPLSVILTGSFCLRSADGHFAAVSDHEHRVLTDSICWSLVSVGDTRLTPAGPTHHPSSQTQRLKLSPVEGNHCRGVCQGAAVRPSCATPGCKTALCTASSAL